MRLPYWLLSAGLVACFLVRDVAQQPTYAAEAAAQAAAAPAAPDADGAKHFDAKIAPLLTRHCLECHGPEKKKGRLDLSRQETAFAGGKSGKALVPGKSAESLLWKS